MAFCSAAHEVRRGPFRTARRHVQSHAPEALIRALREDARERTLGRGARDGASDRQMEARDDAGHRSVRDQRTWRGR